MLRRSHLFVCLQDHATEYDYVVRRITEAHGLIRQAAGIDVRLDREVAKLEVQAFGIGPGLCCLLSWNS